MYYQQYDLILPTTIPISFDCTSSTRFNLEVKNTGINAFSSVTISASFTPDGELQDWLKISDHFDPTASPQPMIKGLHGSNIYNLAPGETGIISFNCEYIYALRMEIDAVDSRVKLIGYGE